MRNHLKVVEAMPVGVVATCRGAAEPRARSATVWVADAAIAAWQAAQRTTPGGQGRYSPVVIETALALRRIFQLPLRQTVSLMASIIDALHLDLAVPDYSTVSRRASHLSFDGDGILAGGGHLHLLLDSRGLRILTEDGLGADKQPADSFAGYQRVTLEPDRITGKVVLRAFPGEQEGDSPKNPEGAPAGEDAYPAASVKQRHRRSGGRLVRTRLHPPVRGGGVIQRERLDELIDLMRQRTITWVRAPAGYGKSSLLCQWFDALVASGAAAGWLGLDRTEDDLVGFFRYVLAAIREQREHFGERMSRMLDAGDIQSAESMCATFIDEVMEAGENVYLFIDDFHLMADDQVKGAVSSILNYPPPNLHIVTASRKAPPFDLSRVRMRNSAVEIDANQLRFDRNEASSFLLLAGHNLTPTEVDAVVSKTEGWAAGIQLAALSLSQHDIEFLRNISGDHDGIASFLAEDVVAHLPEGTIDFLERTAILERMTPELCAALTGNPDPQGQLKLLEQQGLFLFSLDHQSGWCRYHHLFASFLRRRLGDRNPALIPQLHKIASDWFAERGFVEEAIAHAIDAGDLVRAATVLEQRCSELMYGGRYTTLLRWSKKIPDRVLSDFPRLQLEIAWLLILEWKFVEGENILRDVERKMEELAPIIGERWFHTFTMMLIHRKSMLYLFMDKIPELLASVRSIIEAFPHDDPYLRGNLDTNLIYGRREAYELIGIERNDASAREYYEKSGSMVVKVWHESIVAPAFFLRGEPERAEQSLRTAIDVATVIEGAYSALGSIPALLLAEVLYERNDIHGAAELIENYGPQAERKGFLDHLIAFYVTRSRLEFRAGRRAEARATLELGRISAERHGFGRLRLWIDRETFRQAVILNDTVAIEQVCAIAMQRGKGERPGQGTTSGDEAVVLAWARACCAVGEPEQVATELKRWVVFVRDRGAVRSEVRLSIALACCQLLSGREGEAARTMRGAVDKAYQGRFIRSFLDEGKVVETLLQMLFGNASGRLDDATAFGVELLGLFADEARSVFDGVCDEELAAEDEISAPPKLLNSRERKILSMAASGLGNKDVARELGLTETSVKWYMQQIFSKLGVRKRIAAIYRARQFGML